VTHLWVTFTLNHVFSWVQTNQNLYRTLVQSWDLPWLLHVKVYQQANVNLSTFRNTEHKIFRKIVDRTTLFDQNIFLGRLSAYTLSLSS